MLTRVLKDLIDNNLVIRTQFNEVSAIFNINRFRENFMSYNKAFEDFGKKTLE